MSVLDVIDPSGCDAHGVPLDWARCRTCNVDSDGTPIYPDGVGAPDCPTCGGNGSLKSAALAHLRANAWRRGGPHPNDPVVRCEGCGHPMSDGTWEGTWVTASWEYGDNNGWAFAHLRYERHEPPAEILDVPVCTHWSRCDERCRHGGPFGVVHHAGGPIHTSPSDEEVEAARLVIAAAGAVQASWRAVDVRTLGWAADLRPHKLAVLCLRCWAER